MDCQGADKISMMESGTDIKEGGTTEMNAEEGENEKDADQLKYKVQDSPPWYMNNLLGLQYVLCMIIDPLTFSILVSNAVCMPQDDIARSKLFSTILLVSGLCIFIQAAFGFRLSILQGPSTAFVPAVVVLMSLPPWKCGQDISSRSNNSESIDNGTDTTGMNWRIRFNEIQGALIIAGCFEMLVGITGLIGFLIKLMGPLVITNVVTLMGLTIYPFAQEYSSHCWPLALLTAGLSILMSQYLLWLSFPCFTYSRSRGCYLSKYPVFQSFPLLLCTLLSGSCILTVADALYVPNDQTKRALVILLSMLMSWLLCYILTVTGALPDDKTKFGFHVRTDQKSELLQSSSWFYIPYPGQWGRPSFGVSSSIGMLAAVIVSCIESVGDYFATARFSHAVNPPKHAVNRGLFTEGIGVLLCGVFGTGVGTTSYSRGPGLIALTRIASRRVIQFAAVWMVVISIIAKFGALLTTIPLPIIGGTMLFYYGFMMSAGLSNLQFVNLHKSRNLFILGFSLGMGITLPAWIKQNQEIIQTGSTVADQTFTILLSTEMFVGGLVAFFFDNTLPGRSSSRLSNKNVTSQIESSEEVYNFPINTRKKTIFKYIPICQY